MLQISLKSRVSSPDLELSFYSSLNPIPFSLRLGNFSKLPETIYARNMYGENFIEFRFNKENKQLYDVTLVAIQNNTVNDIDTIELTCDNNVLYNCSIQESSALEFSMPMKIYRSKNAIKISWAIDEKLLRYVFLSRNVLIGIDQNNSVCSIILTSLTQEEIFNVLGF